MQVLRVASVLGLAAGLGFGGVGYLTGRQRIVEQERQIAALQEQVTGVRRSREVSEARLRGMVADLDRMGEQQRLTIDNLSDLQDTLRQDLAATQEDLAAVSGERDQARSLAAMLETRAVQGEAAATAAVPASEVAALQVQLASAASERDRLQRSEKGLRWRVEMLETRLGDMRRNVSAEAARMRTWIVSQVNTLEGVLASSGVDVDRLIRRVDTKLSSGQGGPFEPVPAARAKGALGVSWQPAMKAEMSRLQAVHRLLERMPLLAPLKTYRTTSEFGVRRDPITGRAALHTGLDFGGGSTAPILATAPGRVIQAGPAGAYGNMVEIDHGMGITTRYGHLKATDVKVGDRVALHQVIGTMGSTGRSTGEHLHYEVRLDGVAYDPAGFLEAGRSLKNVFKG